jgi:hypothetical protein
LTEAEPLDLTAGAAALGAAGLLLTRAPVTILTAFSAAAATAPALAAAAWYGGESPDAFVTGLTAAAIAALAAWAAAPLVKGAAAGLLFAAWTAAPPFLWIAVALGGAEAGAREAAASLAALSPVAAAARHDPADLTYAAAPAALLLVSRAFGGRKRS